MTITSSPTEAEPRNHPLQDFQLRSISTVDVWLKHWPVTYVAEHRLGMLDMVFSFRESTTHTELIALLLDLADHWYDNKFFLPPNAAAFSLFPTPEMILARNRQAIATAAMRQLCQHFFGVRVSDGEVPCWAALCLKPGIAEKILRLYAPQNGVIQFLHSRYSVRCDLDGTILAALTDFASSFWRMFWELGDGSRMPRSANGTTRWLNDEEKATREHLVTLRPQLIPLIEELDELHELIKGNYRPDPAMLEALRNYALRPTGVNHHQPASLEEILFRSPTAQVVYLLDAINAKEAQKAAIAEKNQDRLRQKAAIEAWNDLP